MSAPMRGVKFHRRTLLAGISAAGAALFSSTLRRSVAEAAVGDPNVIFFFSPNGSLRDNFGADGTSTSFTLRSSLAALAPLKSRIHVIQDINNMGYPAHEVSHSNVTRILTCVNGTEATVAAGPSVDYVLADHFGQTPLVLGVQPVSRAVTYHDKVSWAGAGVPTKPILDSVGTFNRLFPEADDPATVDAADELRRSARNRSILDRVRGDLTTLRGRLGPSGRELLDVHATSLRELEQSLVGSPIPEMMCDLTGLRTSVETPLPAFPTVSRKSYQWTPVLTAHGRLQMDIIAMALACGRRRVATLVWQPCTLEGVNPAGTNNDVGHHDVSHWSTADFSEPISRDEARAQYIGCDEYYVAHYAYLLNKLESLGILGDTFVPWFTDTRDSNHQQGRYHIVVGGGDAHGIKTGRFTQYTYGGGNDPKTVLSNRSFADLWVSTHKMLGIAPERVDGKDVFGPAQYCHGAGLEEVY